MLYRSILITLCYGEVFSSPLTKEEILRWLPLQKTTEKRLSKTLDKMVLSQRIFLKKDFYSLKNHPTPKVSEIYHSKIKTAQTAIRLLKYIPTVQLAAISGSTAAGRPKISSDIDLFIVCSHNTVWITRFFCAAVLIVTGLKRKRKITKTANKICLNMFLDINNLNISPKNIYSARETLQVIPLLNRKGTYERFIFSNIWAGKIFPNFTTGKKKDKTTSGLFNGILLPLGWIFFVLQYLYMYKRITLETVSFNTIRFHPTDYQSIILRKFRDNLAAQNIKLSAQEHKLFFSNSLDKKN